MEERAWKTSETQPPSVGARLLRAWPLFLAVLLVMGSVGLAPWHYFAGRGYLDAYGTQWFFWLVEQRLFGSGELSFSEYLFFPWGKEVYLHTGGNLLDAWLALPLRFIFGPVLGYNTWLTLLLFGNAYAGWRLAMVLGASPWAARVSAALMVISPFALQELQLGRPTQAFLFFPVLCLAELLAMDRPRRALLAGLTMALAGWSYWYFGILCGILAIIHGLWRIVAGPLRLRAAALHALAALVAVALVMPAAWPLLQALDEGQVPGLLALGEDGPLGGLALETVEGDPEGLYVLSPLDGTGGSILDEGGLRYNAGAVMMAPWNLLLLLAGLVAVRSRRWLLVTWVVVAAVISMGPVIILGRSFILNQPYLELLYASDIFRRWWWPGRSVFVLLALAAAVGPLALERWLPRPWLRHLAAGAVLVLAAAGAWRDQLLPLDRWGRETSPGIACLADLPMGAVIDLPYTLDQKHLYLQTLHAKPILGGMLSSKEVFSPAEQREFRRENTLVQLLLDLGDSQYTRRLVWEEEDRQALLDLGYRYVLVRTDAYRKPRLGRGGDITWMSDWHRLRRNLLRPLGEPFYEDDSLAIYSLEGTHRCPGSL